MISRIFLLLLVFVSVISVVFQSHAQGKKVIITLPNTETIQVESFQQVELAFQLPTKIASAIDAFSDGLNTGLNPYDPQDMDVFAVIQDGHGRTIRQLGFYYQDQQVELVKGQSNAYVPIATPHPWRIRFYPDRALRYEVKVYYRIRKQAEQFLTAVSLDVSSSQRKGPLEVSKTGTNQDRQLIYNSTGLPFFALAQNFANAGECGHSPSQNLRMLNALDKFAAIGGNYARFELGGQAALPDWNNVRNYSSKQGMMYAFDQLVERCEEKDIYFTLFRHHVEVWDRADWALVRWGTNPYHTQLGLDIEGYFSDSVALRYQRNTLRYMMARWGYSPQFTCYSYSEVDNWCTKLIRDKEQEAVQDGGLNTTVDAVIKVRNWIEQQQVFIREINPNILFCHSPARLSQLENNPKTSFFALSDIVAIHNYDERKQVNFIGRYNRLTGYWNQFKKPVLLEEMGPNKIAMYCCTGIEFHNSIWSTAFMGGMGTGMDWWWESGIFDFGYEIEFKRLHEFIGLNGLPSGYTPYRWSDRDRFDGAKRSIAKRTLEAYYLVGSDQYSGIGWLHHAGNYWRNLADSLPCLDNLITSRSELNVPCYFSKDAYGFPYAMKGQACPLEHNDVYDHEALNGFNDEKFEDAFTGKGIPTINGERITLDGFHPDGSLFSEKGYWYEVLFFELNNNQASVISRPDLTKLVKSDRAGRLVFDSPMLDKDHPDYGFKVNFLGYY